MKYKDKKWILIQKKFKTLIESREFKRIWNTNELGKELKLSRGKVAFLLRNQPYFKTYRNIPKAVGYSTSYIFIPKRKRNETNI